MAYSVIAYQLGYLKTYYPEYFMAALMTSVVGNDDKISQYAREAKRKGLRFCLLLLIKAASRFYRKRKGFVLALGPSKESAVRF